MLSVPRSKVVRGFSFFGASFVYVIFEDGTDIYWARSRVLEYLNSVADACPKGVAPTLGGCNRRWLGLPIRLGSRTETLAGCGQSRTGLYVISDQGARRGQKSPALAALCSNIR